MLFSFWIKHAEKSNINWMKKEKKANDKAQQEFESSFLNTARNLIYGELSLLPRHFVFPTVSHRGERETEGLVTKREGPVINGSNDRLKELSVTLLNRANSSTRSQKTPAVTWFGHLDFTREEPGTVQKGIELWDSFGENTAFIGYRKRLARLPSLVWVVDVLNSAPVFSLAFYRNKNISQNVLFRRSRGLFNDSAALRGNFCAQRPRYSR